MHCSVVVTKQSEEVTIRNERKQGSNELHVLEPSE